jgi:hypothetical protein
VLPHLSRREVDALLAEELARVWRGHRWSLSRTLGFGLLTIGLSIFVAVGTVLASLQSVWTLAPLIFAGILAVRLMIRPKPHFSPALDRDALIVTGDPEALITALAKLHRLDLLPLVARGDAPAGPLETWPRLQDLADRAGIPPERLREILDGPGSGEDRYPQLPATPGLDPASDPRVFSHAFKRRALAWQSRTGLALEVLPPAVVAYVAQWQQWGGVWLAGAYLAGLPLTVLLRRLGVRYAVLRTSLALRRGIRARLAAEGLAAEDQGGIFVGLSPHAEPRNYESFLVWDLGFLVLAGDRLCYLGDRTRFALAREHVRSVSLGPGGPGWRTAPRVYVAWHDAGRGVGGTFNLNVSEARGLGRPGLRPAGLLRRLRDWLKQESGPADAPTLRAELPAPEFGEVASESLGKVATGNVLLAILLLRAPFAVGACLLLGLSFDRAAGGGGWYVLAVVALLQVGTVLSYLRYRGRKGEDEDADAPASGAIDRAADDR